MESVEEGREGRVLEELVKKACLNTFGRYADLHDLEPLVAKFDEGLSFDAGEDVPSKSYVKSLARIPELQTAVAALKTPEDAASTASAIEFILEGLHLNRRLNRDRVEGAFRYRG